MSSLSVLVNTLLIILEGLTNYGTLKDIIYDAFGSKLKDSRDHKVSLSTDDMLFSLVQWRD